MRGVSEEFLEGRVVITYYSMGYRAHKRKRKERLKDTKGSDKEKLQRSQLYPWTSQRHNKAGARNIHSLVLQEKETI